MFRLALLIVSILFLSCQQTGLQENNSKNQSIKKTSIHYSANQTNNVFETPGPDTASFIEYETDWLGSWYYEQDKIKYSITIDEKLTEMNRCIYQVEGIPAFYVLACRGVIKGNVLELYYRYTHDGNFFRESKIDRHKPILTLAAVNGKIITYWNQLPGGRNGQECFKKEA